MKKLFAILLSLALLLVPALALGEEGEAPADITGLWYVEVQGLLVEMTLNADGTYAVTIPARPDAGVSGLCRRLRGQRVQDHDQIDIAGVRRLSTGIAALKPGEPHAFPERLPQRLRKTFQPGFKVEHKKSIFLCRGETRHRISTLRAVAQHGTAAVEA